MITKPTNGTFDEMVNEQLAPQEKEDVQFIRWNTKIGNEQAE